MKKTMKLLALVLALVMVLSCFAGCKKKKGDEAKTEYTFKSYTTALGTNWNPHTWETNGDQVILSYLETPLATMSIKDSENGVYQWVFKAATSVTDVTAANKADLTKYKVTLPEGQTAEATEKGYVFEIKLNPNMKWQDGTAINADTYIYSMQTLLDPTMRNYRANLYYSGESAVAGGLTYYNSGAPIYNPMVPAYEDEADYSYDLNKGISEGKVYINVNSEDMTLYSDSLATLNSDYKVGVDAEIKTLADAANPYGFTQVTADNLETVKKVVYGVLGLFSITDEAELAEVMKEALFVFDGQYGEKVGYDETVGCYKVDDYTIRYVTQAQIDYNYFLTSCTSNWLVHKDTYEKGFDTTGTLKTTNYATSLDTTMSYGPYKMESLQDAKQVVFVQNENYYAYEKKEDGSLYAETDFLVDGKNVQAYQTTKIVIDVMTDEAAKQAFMKGELSEWTPTADDVANYAMSEQLFQVDQTYTMSLFFNTNEAALKEMDNSKGNQNSVVLINKNFRKAMSLAIDRKDWVTATAGYKPAYSLMSNLYYYDVYNDPNSTYRGTDEAMQAIVDLYGVEYANGMPYGTLKEAYGSINGYNLTEAKALMQQACNELVAAGKYTRGEPIKILIGYAKGELASSDLNQITKLNAYLNAAAEGSGFGTITLEGVGNISNRYDAVPAGEYAIGYGAWGGAAFYPFRNMQVYCDSELYSLNEAACWDPATEEMTINIDGEAVTMTWKDWSNALVGTGPYANSTFGVKLKVTAAMEKEFLAKYYRIPLASECTTFLQSYQMSYYTENYNIMYDFGGLELMTYHYNDAEWATYVANAGGTLSYE